MNLLTNKSLNVIITPEIVFELKTILWLKSLESYIEFIIYNLLRKCQKYKKIRACIVYLRKTGLGYTGNQSEVFGVGVRP